MYIIEMRPDSVKLASFQKYLPGDAFKGRVYVYSHVSNGVYWQSDSQPRGRLCLPERRFLLKLCTPDLLN